MIESKKIYEILQGSNIYSTFYINGWCKTSSGVSFGKERIKELLDYIELEKNDIGLKDINGKSIYANSSIVEWCHPQGNIYNGYFKWNQKELCYEVITIDSNDNYNGIKLKFFYLQMNNLKIIDTIQENKLGLIK